LSRIPMQNITTIRYGGIRNMLYGDIQDPASGQSIRVFGIHLDDRRESLRLKQVKALCREVARSPLPVLLAGDFNAMHSTQWSARLLRSPVVSVPTSLLPNTLLRSLLERVADMARGTVLLQLESVSGLHEVDSAHRATTTLKLRGFDAFPSIRLIAIDHIYIGDAIESTNFSISRDGGSDHRALSVTLAVKG
jgi:endonuclease/exonuclease/phosphatase family metal-dependent hydrolase